jgi:hypothetical protein
VRLDHITPRRFVCRSLCEAAAIPGCTLRKSGHLTIHLNRFHLDACHSFTPSAGLAHSLRCPHLFPGGYSAVVPPDPIPNSEVKRSCADGSVNFHARVGHRQGLYPSNAFPSGKAFVFVRSENQRRHHAAVAPRLRSDNARWCRRVPGARPPAPSARTIAPAVIAYDAERPTPAFRGVAPTCLRVANPARCLALCALEMWRRCRAQGAPLQGVGRQCVAVSYARHVAPKSARGPRLNMHP